MDTLAPYTSATCALISLVVNPLAYSQIATASTSVSRRCRLATITGATVSARSRGTWTLTCPGGVGQDCLGTPPVTDVAAHGSGLVPVVTHMPGHLLLQRRSQHLHGDRLQQPVRAGQILTS